MLIGIASAAGMSNDAIASPKAQTKKAPRHVMIEARPEAIAIDLGKTAVLVIDMQNDFGSKGGMFDRAGIDISGIRAVIPHVTFALAAARGASLPIIYLKMAFRAVSTRTESMGDSLFGLVVIQTSCWRQEARMDGTNAFTGSSGQGCRSD